MTEKTSRTIFTGELIFIVLPLSLLLFLVAPYQVYWTLKYFHRHNFINMFCAILACVALISGYVISYKFLRFGWVGLHTIKLKWWILSSFGAALTVASWISTLFPPSPEYSIMEMFRDDFEKFTLGFPIFIPFAHLILEILLRKR